MNYFFLNIIDDLELSKTISLDYVLLSFFDFQGNMNNLTSTESNQSALLCFFCEGSLIFLPVIMYYILICGPANVWVLWLMISSPLFGTDRMTIFEFHLTITELLLASVEILVLAFMYGEDNMIRVMVTLAEVITVIRNQFQSFICMEQYVAVVHPVLYLRYRPLRYRTGLCCVVWVDLILLVVVQMFLCSISAKVVLYISSFLYNFSFNTFCCVSVLRALKRPSPGEKEREASNVTKRRAFNIVLIFQLVTFLGYMPMVTVLSLVRHISYDMLCVYKPIAYCVMLWFGVIHPILYLRRERKRLVIKDLCVDGFLKSLR